MCGIAAILLLPLQRSQADWLAIQALLTRNLLFNEERGKSATGLAVVQLDGQVNLFKAPLPASEFVQTPQYQDLMSLIGANTTLLLGHTRLPTKGSPARAINNHPLQSGPVFGVHNGHISNDDDLFDQLHYDRQGEVDSEIIFQMLSHVSPAAPAADYLTAIRPQLQLLTGKFTFLACDQRAPTRLLVLKHENPLCMHYHADWQALIFSSRYVFLRKAFGQSVLAEALEHDQLMLFDACSIGELEKQAVETLSLYSGKKDVLPGIMVS